MKDISLHPGVERVRERKVERKREVFGSNQVEREGQRHTIHAELGAG